MKKIDWYYIYSQRYYPHDLYLKEAIPSVFQPNGIFIEQHYFDRDLYKHPGEHFFSRITIKIETILKILEEKRVKNETDPFLFTDVDLIIRPSAATEILKYTKTTDFDILFQKEYHDNPIVNPGVMLMWPNNATESFWKNVLEKMCEKNTMEMTCINSLLPEKIVKWDFFKLEDVCSPITVRHESINSFSIYHLLGGANDRLDDLKDKIAQAKILVRDFEKYYIASREKYGATFI